MEVQMPVSSVGAPGAAATLVLPADPSHRHVIDSLSWSYSGAPTGGGLSVADNGTTVFTMDILVAGYGQIAFKTGLAAAIFGNALTVTLAAGGLSVVGKLNVESHDENA